MRYSELIPLVACMVNFVLTMFVFSRDWRSPINRVYLLWGISLTMWNLGTYFMFKVPLVDTPANQASALFWAKFLQFGVIFAPVTVFHLACLIVKATPSARIMGLLYGLHSIFALSNFSSFFVAGVRIARDYSGAPYAWWSMGGPGFFPFAGVYAAFSFSTIYVLVRQMRFLAPIYRTRVKSLIVGCALLSIFGNNDILPILGVYNYPFTRIPIYPLDSLVAIIYGIIAAHSILQHQLLDIHVTLGRMAALIVRLSFMLAVCLFFLLIVRTFLPSQMSQNALFISMGVFMVSAIIASNFFPRLFGSGSDALERRVLGDRFEYHDKIQGFIQSLPWYTDNASLMDDFHDLLVKTVSVQSYSIVLLDETIRKFSIYRSYPENAAQVPLGLERDSPVFQHFHETKEDCLVLSAEHRGGDRTNLERQARQQLKQFQAEFCYAFFSESDPVGLLLLGQKNGDLPYTPHDLNLMRSVVKNMSLIMNQIRLKKRVLLAEEMELLGRMSRGMAHDLNNLITPVWTYVQLARETARAEDAAFELLPTATRNVETIQTYIKDSLFYSNTLQPHLRPGKLNEIVQKSIQLVKPQLEEKSIQVECAALPEAELELDSVLIQRMICNLLGNAGDASPQGARINVELDRLPPTETSRDWYRLQIIDHGSGISRENLPNVFRPYFTTKDRGSGKRGFGLGLAICRKIVLLHGGNLNITSEVNRGTTVIVDLPTKVDNSMDKPKPILSHAEGRMKTLLVIAEKTGLSEAIRVALDPARYRFITQPEVLPGDILLARGQVDACIIDGELDSVLPMRTIEVITKRHPSCPILIYTQATQRDWEEDAYLQGVTHILTKPVRGPLLNHLLDRICVAKPKPPMPAMPPRPPAETRAEEAPAPQNNGLGALRSFSALLPHGLSIEDLLKQFLLLLRETVAVNRAAIFLCPAPEMLGGTPRDKTDRQLRLGYAIGLPAGVRHQLTLSLDSGVAGQMVQEGRILRRDGEAVQNDPECLREFDMLGAEVALPILDRETFLGVVFFDRRVTGGFLSNEELNQIFYMLEGLGLAIKNITLHQEISANRELLGDILGELKSGCVVIGSDLSVQHANKLAVDFFKTQNRSAFQFRDLPQTLGSKIYETLQSGKAPAPFRYTPPTNGRHNYEITITPFMKHEGGGAGPGAVLLLIEDCSQMDRLRQMEIEAANLRMIKTMSERLAHEIGNAIVPLSTHQQLLATSYKDPEFRASLEVAMLDGVKRIARLGQQMLFLALDRPKTSEEIPVSKLIEEAFREAQKNHGEQPVVLQYDSGGQALKLNGDRAGLKHALAEIMLNALQANAPAPKVKVDTHEDADAAGTHWIRIEVQDSGTGFTPEASRKAPDAFFTTRNVGLGLGLTVSQKIIEMHHGRIEIASPGTGKSGLVTISLPLVTR